MRPDTEQTYRERILKVLVYIQEHLSETISLQDLADVAHFSPYHFHHIFRGMVGESVKEHVRRLRLERAALQLKTTDQAITQIAFAAGYEAHESFTRAFAALFGEAPSQFRESRRSLPQLQAASEVHYSGESTVPTFNPPPWSSQPMNVRIDSVPAMGVAFMRHVGPYLEVGGTWSKLMSWAAPRGLLGPNSKMIGIVHDDPDVTPADKLRYDACIPVAPDFRPEGEVGVQQLAGGDYAVATHRGPYEKLNESYRRLYGEWLPASGREPRSAPAFEVYRNSPMNAAPEDLLTDIYLPLA